MKKLLVAVTAGLLTVGAVGCLAGCGEQSATPPKHTIEEKTEINLDDETLRLTVDDPNYSKITVTLSYAESHVCHCGSENPFDAKHRQELSKHYPKTNKKIIKTLNFTDAESVEFDDYAPEIWYTYSSLEEFMNGDYEKLCNHNSDALEEIYIQYLIPYRVDI